MKCREMPQRTNSRNTKKPTLQYIVLVLLIASSVVCAADPPQRSNMPSPPSTHAAAGDGVRQPGEKRDIVVYANDKEYASFPIIARGDQELVLLFQVQDLAKLRASGEHPHYQRLAVPRWATSRDSGLTWKIHKTRPSFGGVRDIGYGSAPLEDGRIVTLTFSSTEPLQAILQDGITGYRPYQDASKEQGDKYPVTSLGPFQRFYPMGMKRLANGTLLASGYVPFKSAAGRDKTTAAFLTSSDAGRTWTYLSHIPNDNPFDFSEPDIIETHDGRLLTLLRMDWDTIPVEQRPDEAKVGYGYFLYQAESGDGGRTWSEPVQLPIWGHPPCLQRLASGNILLVYGYRRSPWEIRAILSRDDGRTWDMSTMRTVHTFNPGNLDMGYPVATQLADESIVCSFYGYSTKDVGEQTPHGIFVSVFDEKWLTGN